MGAIVAGTFDRFRRAERRDSEFLAMWEIRTGQDAGCKRCCRSERQSRSVSALTTACRKPNDAIGDLWLQTFEFWAARSTRLNAVCKGLSHAAWALLAALAVSWLVLEAPLMAQPQRQHAPVIITKAGQAHDLPANFAPETRLRLTGTITYYDPFDGIMFLQDSSGGVYVNTDKPYPVHAGDLVALNGFPSASYRTEVANDPEIRVIDRGNHFAAPELAYRDLVDARGDCELVSIRGTVRAADFEQHPSANTPSIHMDVAMADGEVQVYVHPPSGFHPESLLDAVVEVTGVAGGAFDAKNQLTGIVLYAADIASIQVLQKPDVSARQLPLTSIDNVFQSLRITDTSRPVRVRGAITYYKKSDAAVLEKDGKSIYVQTRSTADLSVGDIVDAIGFASDREYAPSLREASLVRTGTREQIVPRLVSYAEASSGRYSDNLVSISGVLVSQLRDGDSYTVVIDVDGHLVSGHLEQQGEIEDYQLGSRLQLSGICRIVPSGLWRAAYLSHIEMRSVADVQLVSKPSWYTVQHLLELLGALIVIAMAIAVRAAFLKRRVVNQTAWISRSMIVARERSRILELISSNRSLDELLTEICKSTMELLPGAECSYLLQPENELLEGEVAAPQPVAKKGTLFEVLLPDASGQVHGKIVVISTSMHCPVSDREEIYELVSELAALAMRQSMLYRGLVHHSNHDPLTGLPNRRLCENHLASALKEAEDEDGQMAVIYIDINRFKFVNDKYGHKTGDLYLQQISARLKSQIRSIDMLARVGGDEFVVIAPFAEGIDRSYALTARLKACFDQPFDLDGISIEGSASFGFARYPEHGATTEELTRHADHEMYISKHREAHASEEDQGLAIISAEELELALLRGRFRLAYQPQFSAAGRLTGLETLIRLDDPVLGIITPDAFISVAEKHPVIVGIGAWTLRAALQDAARWKLNTGDPIVIAVNVAVRQLEEAGFAKSVLDCLQENNFPPERLELELIERSLMFSGDNVLQQLEQLREAGVRIALDDFGTGQSCLSLLHRLPIDTIKLDRSFIRAMDNEPRVLPIIKAIVSMAHSLGKRVVAEAVEHVGPVPALLKMGAMDFQGYLLSRPIPAEDVPSFIGTLRSGIVMPEVFREAGYECAKKLD
jgi:diguanylate cyclase (GGDEF)-like protein